MSRLQVQQEGLQGCRQLGWQLLWLALQTQRGHIRQTTPLPTTQLLRQLLALVGQPLRAMVQILRLQQQEQVWRLKVR
jgi:hypothetical protein